MNLLQGKTLIGFVAVLTLGFVGAAYISAESYLAALPTVMVPTAHAAFAFFWMAFSASSFHTLAPSAYSRWAMKNRRYIGLSFAFIHIVHLILVLSNITMTEGDRSPLVLAAGGIAYVFLIFMALTSNNTSVKKLGAQNWKRLHRFGSWYIWAIFVSALPEVFSGKYNRVWIFTLCLALLGMRMTIHLRKKRQAVSST